MHTNYLRAKTGRIYVARNGTVMVFVLDNGETYFASCTCPSNVLAQVKAPQWWVNSIDWECGFTDHFTHGMAYDTNESNYPKAERLTPITADRIEKLKLCATA